MNILDRAESNQCHYPLFLKAFTDFFNATGLPVPNECEYKEAFAGYIIFLNEVGCLIRVVNNTTYPHINHPHVLQPLGSLQAGPDFRIDINPGIRTLPESVKNEHMAMILLRKLKKEKIFFWDCGTRNVGYLPVTSAQVIKNYPVILDPDSVKPLVRRTKEVKNLLPDDAGLYARPLTPLPENTPQAHLYSYLRQAFTDAWPVGAPKPDVIKMLEFWRACRDARREGRLVTGWDDKKNQRGHAYARRWSGPIV